MKERKKLKLKKFYLHPVTTFILLTILTMVLSGIFSLFEMQATYTTLNTTTGELENTLVTVENLFSFDGIKYIISNAAKNFMSFTTLSTLLISLIGLGVAQATGLLDTFIKRVLISVVIFLVPTIVDIIMYLADIVLVGFDTSCSLW